MIAHFTNPYKITGHVRINCTFGRDLVFLPHEQKKPLPIFQTSPEIIKLAVIVDGTKVLISDASDIAVNPQLDNASIGTSSGANQAGNSDIANQIAGLKTFKGMQAGTATLNEFYNAQITDLAVTTQGATNNSYHHGLVSKALGDQRESVVGVYLDEEAADMAKAQKAYQGAARVLTAYDDLLDLVLNRMGLVGR